MNNAIKQEYVTAINGERYFVSTVDLNFFAGLASFYRLPFETMVFAENDSTDLFCDRYATREQALEGHVRTVANINAILGLDTSGNI